MPALVGCQRFPQAIQAALLAVFGHLQHAPSEQIIHQSQIAVSLPKRLLVHTNLANQLRLPPSHATLHRPLQDAVDLVPTELQQPGYGFLTGRLQPGDGQSLK